MTQAATRFSRPFIPSKPDKPGAVVGRAAFVAAKHAFRYAAGDSSVSIDAMASKTYPNDSILPNLVTRAAVSPASLTGTGWAAELAATVTTDFISSMAGRSAAAKLIDAGVKLSFEGNRAAAINIPSRPTAPAADMMWVAELAPMPVLSFSLSALTLTPHKLTAAAAATREVVESGNGEQVIGQLLKEDLSYTLDATMFSATAGSTTSPRHFKWPHDARRDDRRRNGCDEQRFRQAVHEHCFRRQCR